ncbi:MAG: DUF1838 family protein [Bacteroidota bacterium]
MSKLLVSLILFTILLLSCESNNGEIQEAVASLNLDLDRPEDNLLAFAKVRADLEGEEMLYYASGTIYGFVAGERDKPLMGFEMYNIARLIEQEEGYQLLTRELGFYKDLETGKILEEWENPYTGETVEVVQVWNDPVNQEFKLEGRFGKWGVNHTKLSDDLICMNADVFLIYPSPLKTADYPENSQSDNYEAAELFQFFFSEEDVNNPDLTSVPATISWTRIGPWLPWMKMGQRPGNMVYQTSGYKLAEKDYNSMPKDFRDYIMANKPEYRHAPDTFSRPNETSWTYFKKLNPLIDS